MNFLLDKVSLSPGNLGIAENLVKIFFAKGHHILYAIFNTGQTISMIKFSPMSEGGEIGENFLLAKISTCTVCICAVLCGVCLQVSYL